MKKDLPENKVENIAIAVVLMSDSPTENHWNVYLINLKDSPIQNVMVSSKGYGIKEGKEVKTSLLRHSLGELKAHSFKAIEAIDSAVFGLTNEFWLSYYEKDQIYDKKYIFLPESIVDEHLIRIPYINKAGILIK